MSDVDVTLFSAGLGNSNIDVWLSDEDLLKLYRSSFEGYCVACHNARPLYSQRMCCTCFEEEIKKHDVCCENEIAEVAGVGE